MTEHRKTNHPGAVAWSVALLTLAFLVWGSIFIYRTSFIAIDNRRYFCLFDDAMISMRYAWNLSHGAGLVWNAGERIQGYTNLLMTLLMSAATFFFDKSGAALAVQILGLGFIPAIAFATLRIARQVFEDTAGSDFRAGLAGLLVFLFALSYYPLTYWSLMGMETGLLTLLLLLSILFIFRYSQTGKMAPLLAAGTLLGLAFLTRNDSIVFAVPLWAWTLWDRQGRHSSRRALVELFAAMVIYSLFAVGQFLFQGFYYGEMVPNTYILKMTGMPFSAKIANGLAFTLPFLIQVALLLLPVIADSFLHFGKRKLLLLSLILASIGYQVYIGGDAWNYWRFMSPTIPLLGILFIGTVNTSLRSEAGSRPSGTRSRPLQSLEARLATIVLLGIVVLNAYFLPEILFLERPFYVSANEHNVNIAVALSETTSQDATLGTFWAGAIPYFAGRQGIDFLGKSDRYIAQRPPDLTGAVGTLGMKSPPGHNKYDLDYSIRALHPTYVEGFKWGAQDLTDWSETMYVDVEYKGVLLHLLRDSTAVRWERLAGPAAARASIP